MNRVLTWRVAVAFGALAALPLLPFMSRYYLLLAFDALLFGAIAMSLDLLVGYTGLVSLGHAAFFGISGYILALSTPQYQAANFWLSLPLAMAGAGVLALVIGCLVLRVTGVYFIMVTLAFVQMLHHPQGEWFAGFPVSFREISRAIYS